MSTPNGPGTPNQPGGTGGPAQQPGAPQFIPPGQGQLQGHQGPPQGHPGNMNIPPQGPATQGRSGPPQAPQGPPVTQGPPVMQGPPVAQGQPVPPPYGAGYTQQGAGQSPKNSKTGLWVGIGAVAVVVVVALALVLSGVFSGGSGGGAAGGAGGSGKSADPKETAKTIATNYLTAISEGRATDAKKLLYSISDDDSLLTDEVLKDSLTRAPITDINVGEPTGEYSSFDVSVTYKVGDELASDEYKVSTGSGKILTSLPSLRLYSLKGVDITVNGVKAKSGESSHAVFPGSYVVASANKYLEVDGNTTVVVTSGKDHTSSSDLKLKVSQAGIDLFREKVVAEAKACLASKALDPGCNIAINATTQNGGTVAEGSVTRTQNSENDAKLENAVPKPGTSVPTIISARDLGEIQVTATCTDSRGSGPCKLLSGKGARFPTASLNVAEENPKVTWEER